jgi:hypothetical protein
MGIDDDPRVLGVLLGIAMVLYLASWLLAGPPPSWQGAAPEAALPEAASTSGWARLEQGRGRP